MNLVQARRKALMAGLISGALCIVGAMVHRDQFFQSYLFAYSYWFGITMGCLGILLIYQIVGGAWGDIIQPLLRAASLTLPLLALFFIPIVIGMRTLYPWARPEEALSAVILHKHAYLNPGFFTLRAIGYFLIWGFLAFQLEALHVKASQTSDVQVKDKPRQFGAVGLVIYFLTLSFAYIDWMMSLEPDWISTVYPALVIIGDGLSALAFVVLALKLLSPTDAAASDSPKPFIDLGNMVLTFVMFWAYLALSQYLIIWSGNIPDEISWYLHRQQGAWFWIAMLLIAFQFVLPFLVLLGRDNKRRLSVLARVAILLLVIRFVEMYWLVLPPFHPQQIHLHWLDLIAPLGVGGFWLFAFISRLQKRPSPIGHYEAEARS